MSDSRGSRHGLVVSALLAFSVSAPAVAQQQYGPTQIGEGVYSIARQFRDPQTDLNLRQWALAIYAGNRAAFSGGLNTLRAGTMLTIPSSAKVRETWAQGLSLEQGSRESTPTSAPTSAPLTDAQMAAIDVNQAVPPPTGLDGLTSSMPDSVAAASAPVPGASPAAQAPPRKQDVTPASADTGSTRELPAFADAPSPAVEPFANHPVYAQALSVSNAKERTQALEQLLALEAEYAGDPDFDYALGVLLLDSGRPQDALFPLLRATQIRPQGLGIRLDLGRAYFETGENESARQVFEHLGKQNPPPRAAQVIDSYLQAIQRRAARYQPRWQALVDLLVGHDSNANSATDLQTFAGFVLDEQARSSDSPYAELAANLQHALPVSPRWRWVNMAQVSNRSYTDADEFNTMQWRLGTGLSYRQGDWELSGNLSGGQTYLDGEQNNDVAALNGAWRLNLSPLLSTRLQFKLGTIRYQDALSVRDVDQWLVSAGFSRRVTLAYGSEFGLDLIGGRDDAVESNSPNSRDVLGAGAFVSSQITPHWRVQLKSNLLQADYDGSFFGIERSDVQWFTVAGLRFTDNRWKNWAFGLDASYVDNQSDVDIYEYDRLDIALRVSWMLN